MGLMYRDGNNGAQVTAAVRMGHINNIVFFHIHILRCAGKMCTFLENLTKSGGFDKTISGNNAQGTLKKVM